MSKALSHSYSSIKLFENCPLRYEAQRITKTIKDEGGEASIHGDRVHKALEARVKSNISLPQDMAEYEPLVAGVVGSIGNGRLEVEYEMTINRNMRETGWWDKDAWLRSKLDILLIKGPDAMVLDWKTGKRRVDFFQLKLFAAQVFLRFPEVETVKTCLVWLKTKEHDAETYQRGESKELWHDVLSRITRIEGAARNDNWPAKPSGLCPYCPLYNSCGYALKRR